jgi:VWFA-related protein
MLDFTDDREKIRAALYRIQPAPVFRSVCGANVAIAACPEKLSYLHAYKVMTGDSIALGRAVSAVTGSRLGPPGRNLPSDSPLELRAEMAANAPLAAGERETELSLHTLRDLSRRMASLAGRRTIVLLSHGFLVTDTLQDELAESIDRAIRSGVVIHTLNSSGLIGPGGGGSPWDDDTVGPNGTSPYAHEAQLDGAMTLEDLAEATGGTAIENSNDYLGGVRRLAAPPEYRYVLGFAPQDLVANGSFHRLTIKLEHKGYTIQARRGYYAPKRSEGLTEAAAKEIENEVFARDELHDLSVDLRTEVSAAVLTVSADLDLKSLHLRQAGGRNSDDVTVVAVVFDHNGNFIAGKQQLLKLSLLDQTVASLDRQPTETLKSTFDLSPGAYLVRLVVRSAEGETMAAASRPVEIP